MAGYLHTEIVRVIRPFMRTFVKTSVINSASNVTKVTQENQHGDEILAVDMAARIYLAENEDIYPDLRASFFRYLSYKPILYLFIIIICIIMKF